LYITICKDTTRCIHLEICNKYGLRKKNKIRKRSVQECIANNRVEIRVDTRIPTGIQVKYNKPDIFIYDKMRNEIVIVEVGITSFDNLHTVETEKKHKYDLLANQAVYKENNTIDVGRYSNKLPWGILQGTGT